MCRALHSNGASFSRRLQLAGGGDEIFMAAVVCGLRGPRETFPLFYGANIHFPHRPGRGGQEGGRKGAGGGASGESGEIRFPSRFINASGGINLQT